MKLLLDPHSWLWNFLEPDRLVCRTDRAVNDPRNTALATRSVRLPHRDPADRFLVATALIHGLTLVTADQNIGNSEKIPVLLNR
jgi:PIN domain nuclease of toxin-antitoxin system